MTPPAHPAREWKRRRYEVARANRVACVVAIKPKKNKICSAKHISFFTRSRLCAATHLFMYRVSPIVPGSMNEFQLNKAQYMHT